MPGVQNASADVPKKLERYEVEPGVFLKLTADEYAADQERRQQELANRAAWERTTAGEAPAPEAPASDVVPLTILSKAELVGLAEARGLATSGSKATIAARFVEAEADASEDEGDGDGEPEATPAG